MKELKEFFDNKPLMKAWAQFIVETLNEEALKRVYKGQGTEAVKEAHDIIDKSFVKLAQQFTPKEKPRKTQRAV